MPISLNDSVSEAAAKTRMSPLGAGPPAVGAGAAAAGRLGWPRRRRRVAAAGALVAAGAVVGVLGALEQAMPASRPNATTTQYQRVKPTSLIHPSAVRSPTQCLKQ